MRFGFVLPFYLPDEQRLRWAESSLRSISKTNLDSESPVLVFVVKNNHTDTEAEQVARRSNLNGFERIILQQPEDANSVDAAFVYCVSWILTNRPDVTLMALVC